MPDTLVVYYSRSGVCETAARILAERLGADVEAIKPVADYKGRRGLRRALWHRFLHWKPRLEAPANPSRYGLVILVFPIWAGDVAAPVRSYLHDLAPRIVRLGAVCVSGSGQPYEKAFATVARLTGQNLAATLALGEAGVKAGDAGPALDRLIADLREPLLTAA